MLARLDNLYIAGSMAIALILHIGGLKNLLWQYTFNGEGHTLADMTVVVIDQLYSQHPCLRELQESRLIRTLGN